MSRTIAIALALSAVFLFTAPSASAFEYVRDGGFESGTGAWESNGAALTSAGEPEITPLSGERSGRVGIEAGRFILMQKFRDVPAGSYVVTAGAFRSTTAFEITLNVTSDASNEQLSLALSGSEGRWHTASGVVTFDASTDVVLRIEGGGPAGGAVYIDGVSFTGAPPATRTPTATSTPAPSASATSSTTATATPSATATPTATAIGVGYALVNGGFEDLADDAAPAGWQKYGGSLTSVTMPVRSGSAAARLESTTSSTKWLYQTVLVEPGEWYGFGAWVYAGDADVAAAFLRVSWYEAADGSGQAIASNDSTSRLEWPSSEYRYLATGPIVAPDSAHSARLRVMLAPRSDVQAMIYVDDATFRRAEPPPDATPVSAVASVDQAGTTGGGRRASRRLSSTGAGGSGVAVRGGTSGDLLISEVMYDPDVDGPDGDNEWVELCNRGDGDVDLAGWTLSDANGGDVLPPMLLPAGGFVVIAASASFFQAYPESAASVVVLGSRIGNGLGNDGDVLVLRDPSGKPVDMLSWGFHTFAFDPAAPDVPAGHSLERWPPERDTDTAADWVDSERPSPGAMQAPATGKPGREAAISGSGVEIISAQTDRRWLPWAIAASSASILLTVMAWRLTPLALHRLRART